MSTVFRLADLPAKERYKLLCAAVIPRPVAWITTLAAGGTVNAAPFSFFNVFSEDPALVIVGIERREGRPKDTVANAEAAGAFTANLADTALAEAMVATAAAFPPDVGEAEALGLALEPGITTAVPRLRDAPVSLECTLFELRALGNDRHLLMGEVTAVVAREGLFDPARRRLTVPHWDPVARLYATSYAALGEPYEIQVPDWRTVRRAAE
jgi:flavin reductase (DIM6/NTAB) family NADH-FMN oxidoreductase RutF